MRKFIISLLVAAFLVTTMSYVASAVEPKEAFTIDFMQNKKPGVVFPHKKHSAENGVECKTCHHTMASKDDTPQACKECHKKGADTDIGDGKVAPNPCFNEKCTKNIFHERCRGCHKENGKGPTKCKQCHVKE